MISKRLRCSLKHSPNFPEEDSAEIVDLKKNLVSNAEAYGYAGLEAQRSAIKCFSEGKNVILRAVPESSDDTPLEDGHIVHHNLKERFDGGYMPAKIATYCLGILNQIDLSGPVTCQCLIIVFDGGYIDEVVEDMQKLGGDTIKVSRVNFEFFKNPSFPHVAVGDVRYLLFLLAEESFCFHDVKMLVFDWGWTISYMEHLKNIQKIYRRMRQYSSNKLQFALFSETRVPNDFKVGRNSREKIEFLDYPAHVKCTPGGIKKHMFVNVQADDEDSMKVLESKVNAIVDVIKNVESDKRGRIVVVVSGSVEYDRLTEELKKHCKVIALWKGMTQKDRDNVVATYLRGEHVLITRRVWYRDMPCEYFTSKVRLIIYYECREVDYTQTSMGWYQCVDAAITVVNDAELNKLLYIQKNLPVSFERMEPSKFGGATKFGRKVYVFMVGSDELKIVHMQDLGDIMIATGQDSTTSVIFVKEANLVGVVDNLKVMFKDAQSLVITNSIDEAAETMKKVGHSCIFVTGDCEAKIDEIKKDVRVLIIYDTPVVKDDYCHLFGLCSKEGVVIHLVTCFDCFELFDIQVNLGAILEPFRVGFATDHLESAFPVVYPPSQENVKQSGKRK